MTLYPVWSPPPPSAVHCTHEGLVSRDLAKQLFQHSLALDAEGGADPYFLLKWKVLRTIRGRREGDGGPGEGKGRRREGE